MNTEFPQKAAISNSITHNGIIVTDDTDLRQAAALNQLPRILRHSSKTTTRTATKRASLRRDVYIRYTDPRYASQKFANAKKGVATWAVFKLQHDGRRHVWLINYHL